MSFVAPPAAALAANLIPRQGQQPATRGAGVDMWSKILVPLDGSVEAAASVPLAQVLAPEMHAEIVLLRVVERDDEQRDAIAYLDHIAASLMVRSDRTHNHRRGPSSQRD
jgi:hypothetical protein